MADACRHGAVQEPRGRDVGDDDVVERHLLQRHLGMLGVGHAVGKVRVGHADGKIPERVVDVAARDDEFRVAKQQLGDRLVDGNRGRGRIIHGCPPTRASQYRPPSLRWSQLTTFSGATLSTTRFGPLAPAPGWPGAALACAPARASNAALTLTSSSRISQRPRIITPPSPADSSPGSLINPTLGF